MTVILKVTCRARVHETEAARADGCVCPTGWGQPYRPAVTRKPKRSHRYVRGSISNRRGPYSRTVTEPDDLAVDRFCGGDRTLVLAKVERDAAIDHLDQYGLSARSVAIRLGVTQRTVTRRRAVRRAAALTPDKAKNPQPRQEIDMISREPALLNEP